MKLNFLIFLCGLLLIIGCANYKQLKPKPELSFKEQGYIELKNNKKDFELKKDKKYFITFPAPQEDKFYLVLNINEKQKFNSFLTDKLIKNKKPGEKIADESHDKNKMSVYAIDKRVPMFYWLIDNISQDVVLKLEYRYAPQWRFKFENKYAEFKDILKNNRVDRSTYQAIGISYHFENFNFPVAIDTISRHAQALDKLMQELLAIESIFPQSILNSSDKAYLNYKELKSNLEDEMTFQANYLLALGFFHREKNSRTNPSLFLEDVDDFITYFTQKDRLPGNVLNESKKVIEGRLREIVPFYDQRLGGKDDEQPFDPKLYRLKELNLVGKLYNEADLTTPGEYTTLVKFVNSFDNKSKALQSSSKELAAIKQTVANFKKMPDNAFFGSIVDKTEKMQRNIPTPINEGVRKYFQYRCTARLNEAITQFTRNVENQVRLYREAENIVPQLNVFKSQQDYRAMLGILKQKRHLVFLINKYKRLDKMSVDKQVKDIRGALSEYRWRQSEAGLTRLHNDKNYLNLSAILPVKLQAVRELEDSLYIRIDRISRQRINKFLDDNLQTLENVDELYNDSVFFPAYDVKFSTGSKNELIRRKEELIAHLAKTKETTFPMKAVKKLYEQFMKNPGKSGVLMARAIVTHGKHYTGDDQKTKRRIAECDPLLPKWITKPKQYRRVFALPVTDNRKGKNRYRCRLNIRIPTEAKFPVYDVNIKLPKTVAKNAATKQWYDKITLNKKILKNEGRFTISAPTPSSNYECQITPMRVRKDKSNILDIYFSHNSFKVFNISVMVQKPIIKKN